MRPFELMEKTTRGTDENSAAQKAAETITKEHASFLLVTEGDEHIPKRRVSMIQ